MAEFFEMPQASPTMEAGRILSWKKQEGDELKPQDVIAEVETDKAAMEIEVFDKGVLLKILAQEDDEVPAGQPIAIIGSSKDEDISALLEQYEKMKGGAEPARDPATSQAESNQEATPAPKEEPHAEAPAPQQRLDAGLTPFSWHDRDLPEAIMEMPEAFVVEGAAGEAPEGGAVSNESVDTVRAAPAARKAARERGVDLRQVKGTGPRGRVMRADVEQARQQPAGGPAAAPAGAFPGDEKVRNSQMRKTIARRLKQVWQEAPSFYLTARLDCDRLVAFRTQMKEAGVKVSYNDLVIKACAKALRDVPAVNASWGEDAITRHGRVHIGVAVAIDAGLITPVIRDADTKGLATISGEVRELAGRAREQKLKPDEYQGSTFTISNLGMMGIEHFTAILNPPEAAILAVGGMQQEPVVVDGALSMGWRMRVTLTCDHRVVDGALGAEFLQAVRRYVENPALLAA